MNPIQTACFTGHRPNKLGGYVENNPIMSGVKVWLERAIRQAVSQGIDSFISGMALGVDQAAAETVLVLKREYPEIKLVAAVPFLGQEGKWPRLSQDKYKHLLEQCDQVHIVCEGHYAVWKMQKRNEWMVDRASAVIAVWDGTTGGTGNCVEYARNASHNPQIWRIDPLRKAVQ